MDARRNQIMDALQDCIRRKGIANTSIHDVAARAKLSIGAIYVHFKSKDEILLAAVQRSNQLLKSGEHFAQFGDPRKFWPLIDGLLEHYEQLQHAAQSGANLELMLVARHDPKLRREIEINQQANFAFLRSSVTALPGAAALPAADVDALAAAINSLMSDADIRALVGIDVQRALKRRAIKLLVSAAIKPPARKA